MIIDIETELEDYCIESIAYVTNQLEPLYCALQQENHELLVKQSQIGRAQWLRQTTPVIAELEGQRRAYEDVLNHLDFCRRNNIC